MSMLKGMMSQLGDAVRTPRNDEDHRRHCRSSAGVDRRWRGLLGAALIGAVAAGCAMTQTGTPAPAAGAGANLGPNLGRIASAAEIATIDISIPPSGAGLPPGRGTARAGAAVYAAKCAACHGAKGEGKPADALVGGIGSLASKSPVRTVGSFWPYATTLFDYTRRSMPINAPMSLSNDEVYALTAHMLALNGIIGEDVELNAQSLPKIPMPNRNGFIDSSIKR
jgi:S-disulfanyl-L-cysteine oxidoreductase SoxD